MLLPATDTSCIAEARRTARQVGRDAGFTDEGVERVAIVVTELTSNILKHAGAGWTSVQTFDDAEGSGVEITACDNGPGIADLARSMVDGHSTAGTNGTGLGAVNRLSRRLHVYSRPGRGTAIVARIVGDARAPVQRRFLVAGTTRPIEGEHACGDAYAYAGESHAAAVMMADGLGHGPLAEKAAREAVAAFLRERGGTAQDKVAAMHAALRPTRGAAVAVAVLDVVGGNVGYCGIGNISGALVENGCTKRMITEHGITGHAGRVRALAYPFASPPLVILHSDGIKTSWDLAAYPGLSEAHPALVVAVLLRDFRRGRDDAGLVAVRWKGQP